MPPTPLRYSQILDEFNQWKDDTGGTLKLERFAKLRDRAEGTRGMRQSAYNDNILKRINAGVDKVFSPVSQFTAPIGRSIGAVADRTFGTESLEQIGEDVFRAAPRFAVEMLPFTGGTGLLSRGAGIASKVLPTAAKALGIGSAGTAAYTETDSPVAGLITGGMMPLIPFAGRKGAEVAQKALLRPTTKAIAAAGTEALPHVPKLPGGLSTRMIEEFGREVGFLAHGAVQQEGMSLASGQGLMNPLSIEEMFANVLGNVAFAPLSIRQLARKHVVNGVSLPSETHLKQAKMVTDHQKPIFERIQEEAKQFATERVRQAQSGAWSDEQTTVNRAQQDYDMEYEMFYSTVPKTSGVIVNDDGVTIPRQFPIRMPDPRTPIQKAQDQVLGRGDVDPKSGVQYTDPTGLVLPDSEYAPSRVHQRFVEESGLNKPGEPKEIGDLDSLGTRGRVEQPLSSQIKSLKDVVATVEQRLPPDALAAYRKRGFLPEINEAWLQKEFKEQLDSSITGSFEEAYDSFVTSVQNRYDQLLDTAKRSAVSATDFGTTRDSATRIQERLFTALESAPETLKDSLGRAWAIALGGVGKNQRYNHTDGLAERITPLIEAGNFNAAGKLLDKFISAAPEDRLKIFKQSEVVSSQSKTDSFEALTENVNRTGEVEESGLRDISLDDESHRVFTDALSLLDQPQLDSIFERHLPNTRFKGRKSEDFRDVLIAALGSDSGVKRDVMRRWVKKEKGSYVDLPIEQVSLTQATDALRNVFGPDRNRVIREIAADVVRTAVGSGDAQARGLTVEDPAKKLVYKTADPFSDSDAMEAAVLKRMFSEKFGQMGYSKAVADHTADIALRAHLSLGLGTDKISVRRLLGPENQLGVALYPDRVLSLIGLNLDNASPAQLLITLGHEQAHHFFARASELRKGGATLTGRETQVIQAVEGMERYSDSLTEAERAATLEGLYNIVVPLAKRQTAEGRELSAAIQGYLSKDTPEFMAEYTGVLLAGMAGDGKRIVNSGDLKWLPIEERMYAAGIIRSVADAAEVVLDRAVAEVPFQRSAVPQSVMVADLRRGLTDFHKNARSLVRNSKVVDDSVIRLNNFMASLTPGSVAFALDDVNRAIMVSEEAPPDGWSAEARVTYSAGRERVQQAVQDAQEFIIGKQIEKVEPNLIEDWLSPFATASHSLAKKGLPLVEDAKQIIFNLQPGISRVLSAALAPVLLRNARGREGFDLKSPLLKVVNEKNPARSDRERAAISDIGRKMQEERAPLSDPKLRETAATALANLNPDERANVVGSIKQMTEVYHASAVELKKSYEQNLASRAARTMQFKDQETPAKQLLQSANEMVALAADPTALATHVQNLIQTGMKPEAVMAGANLVTDLAPVLGQLQSHIDTRGGWFMSEQRPGQWIVESTGPEGDKAWDPAETEGHAKEVAAELKKAGRTVTDAYDKYQRLGTYAGSMPAHAADQFLRLEQGAVDKAMKRIRQSHGDDVADILVREFDPGRDVQQAITTAGVGKFNKKRFLKGGRERLDYVSVMRDYVTQLASSVSKRDARLNMEVILNDPSMRTQDKTSALLRRQLEAVLAPNNKEFHGLKSGLSSYFLGMNLSSAVIELSQGAVALVPRLMETGMSMGGAYKLFGKGIQQMVQWNKPNTLNQFAESAVRKQKKGLKITDEEERAVMYRQMFDDSIADWGHLEDLNVGKDTEQLLREKFGKHGLYEETTPGQLANNMLYLGSQKFLWLYSRVANWNTRIALLAGLESGQKQGLHGEALYEHAKQINQIANFGGGRAGRPGYIARLSTDSTRSALGLVHTLQQYTMGITGMMAQLGRDAIGRNKALTPVQRKNSQKAFGTMMMTVTSLSGALGLPGVGAALTLMEKLFGVEAHKAVREGLASIAGDDEELGNVVSDVALNGAANQFLGVDISSRTGINSLVGFSTYEGFNVADLLGPAGSIVKNFYDATRMATTEGDFAGAAKKIVPQSFKNSVELATNYHKYGDLRFMDRGSNLIMKPNDWEAMAYAIGFRPKQLRDWRTAQQMMKVSDEMAGLSRGADLNNMARQLLKNPNPGVVLQYIQQKTAQDPLANPNDMLRSIVDRAARMTLQRDLLDTGLRANVGTREAIARMFGDTVQRKSELEVLQFKQQLLQRLGFPYGTKPATQRDQLKAMMIDQFTSQGMSRTRALDQVRRMM